MPYHPLTGEDQALAVEVTHHIEYHNDFSIGAYDFGDVTLRNLTVSGSLKGHYWKTYRRGVNSGPLCVNCRFAGNFPSLVQAPGGQGLVEWHNSTWDEESGAIIGVPGKDGGPSSIYKWEDLKTDKPWREQAATPRKWEHLRRPATHLRASRVVHSTRSTLSCGAGAVMYTDPLWDGSMSDAYTTHQWEWLATTSAKPLPVTNSGFRAISSSGRATRDDPATSGFSSRSSSAVVGCGNRVQGSSAAAATAKMASMAPQRDMAL